MKITLPKEKFGTKKLNKQELLKIQGGGHPTQKDTVFD